MFKKPVLASSIILILSGCASQGIQPIPSPEQTETAGVFKAQSYNMENEIKMPGNGEPISPYLIYSDNTHEKYFEPINVNSRNEIPNLKITSNVRLVDYDLNSIMVRLTDAANMSFIIDREVMSQKASKSFKLRGNFQQIMDQVARAFDIVYDVNGNNISIKKRTEFSVQIPPMNPKAKRAIMATLSEYGAKGLVFNNDSTLHYVADYKASERIEGYLDMVKKSKSLIVYDIFVWDVTLNGEKSIDWAMYDKLVMSLKDSTKGMDFNPSSSVTMQSNCRENSAIDPTFIQTFLSSQGQVKYFSQPDFMLLSGTDENISYSKYMDNGDKAQIGKTVLHVAGDYTGGLVRTSLELQMGTYENDGNPKKPKLGDRMDTNSLFSVYPGGSALITGIESPNLVDGKRSEVAVLVKPSIILLDKPTNGFFQFQENNANRACQTELRERENSVTFRKLVIDQSIDK